METHLCVAPRVISSPTGDWGPDLAPFILNGVYTNSECIRQLCCYSRFSFLLRCPIKCVFKRRRGSPVSNLPRHPHFRLLGQLLWDSLCYFCSGFYHAPLVFSKEFTVCASTIRPWEHLSVEPIHRYFTVTGEVKDRAKSGR